MNMYSDVMNTQFSRNLSFLMDSRGMHEHGRGAFLSQLVGISRSSISKWLSGQSTPANPAIVVAIAQEFGVKPGDLMFEDLQATSSITTPEQAGVTSVGLYSQSDYNEDKSPSSLMSFSPDFFTESKINHHDVICIQLRGDSMSRVMPDGTVIAVDKSDRRIVDGEIYALIHGGTFRVKIARQLPSQGLELASYNDEIETERYTEEEVKANSIKVIGRVFWWSVTR